MDRAVAGIKTPRTALADVRARLMRTWPETVLKEQGWRQDSEDGDVAKTIGPRGEPPSWPHPFPLGQPGSAKLASSFGDVVDLVTAWRKQEDQDGLTLSWRGRRVHGTDQQLPTHLVVPDIDTAARITSWQTGLETARARARVLLEQHPDVRAAPTVLRKVIDYDATDFDLLLRAARWFADRAAAGTVEVLTPRQVPIEGLHAKWLDTRHALVRSLAGIDDLGLLPPHPPRLHFTYLDPAHLAAGGRRHDCATVGDRIQLPYTPCVVVISENKDTAIHFPPLSHGVAVEGSGRGGSTAASFEWITGADAVIYWGDMDADGFEILDEFRAVGVPARSLFMDHAAYDRWEPYGTDVDRHGKPLQPRAPRPTPYLTSVERTLYEDLCSPSWDQHRRIEQERIPLHLARAAVSNICTLGGGIASPESSEQTHTG
ncbi:Wadjet anti-phage system protein JetD domain-containing protein [Amycolatopsis sp. NPDC004368]